MGNKNNMRKLKYHEQKLLRKVDFYQYKHDNHQREVKILRKYHIQKHEDYVKYNRLCGKIKQLVKQLLDLRPHDEVRINKTNQLLEKLYEMGIITNKRSLILCDKITASAFCRRRLPVVMVKNKMAENLKDAVKFIEQGHIRVGPHLITDPAYLVTRTMEDFVTWTDSSKIKQKVMTYNDTKDDFDIMN